jgi:hypothetical protein
MEAATGSGGAPPAAQGLDAALARAVQVLLVDGAHPLSTGYAALHAVVEAVRSAGPLAYIESEVWAARCTPARRRRWAALCCIHAAVQPDSSLAATPGTGILGAGGAGEGEGEGACQDPRAHNIAPCDAPLLCAPRPGGPGAGACVGAAAGRRAQRLWRPRRRRRPRRIRRRCSPVHLVFSGTAPGAVCTENTAAPLAPSVPCPGIRVRRWPGATRHWRMDRAGGGLCLYARAATLPPPAPPCRLCCRCWPPPRPRGPSAPTWSTSCAAWSRPGRPSWASLTTACAACCASRRWTRAPAAGCCGTAACWTACRGR